RAAAQSRSGTSASVRLPNSLAETPGLLPAAGSRGSERTARTTSWLCASTRSGCALRVASWLSAGRTQSAVLRCGRVRRRRRTCSRRRLHVACELLALLHRPGERVHQRPVAPVACRPLTGPEQQSNLVDERVQNLCAVLGVVGYRDRPRLTAATRRCGWRRLTPPPCRVPAKRAVLRLLIPAEGPLCCERF